MRITSRRSFELIVRAPSSGAPKSVILPLLLIAALVFTAPLHAQSAASVTLIKAGRLLDPRSGKVLSPAAVLVEDGRIKQVGSPAEVQADAGASPIDLGEATL